MPHDLWDYDVSQPGHLFTLEMNGRQIPALGHANKNGYYFLLDRRDGTPLVDVKEASVAADPASAWQHASPTQPVPATDVLTPHSVDITRQARNPPHSGRRILDAASGTAPYHTAGFEAGPNYTRARVAHGPSSLLENKILGWMHGRMEFGPRALGKSEHPGFSARLVFDQEFKQIY